LPDFLPRELTREGRLKTNKKKNLQNQHYKTLNKKTNFINKKKIKLQEKTGIQ